LTLANNVVHEVRASGQLWSVNLGWKPSVFRPGLLTLITQHRNCSLSSVTQFAK